MSTYKGTVYCRGWDAGKLVRNEAFSHHRYKPLARGAIGNNQVCIGGAPEGSAGSQASTTGC